MKTRSRAWMFAGTLAVLILSLAPALARRAEEEPKAPPMSPEQQAMMERWNAYMTPGEEHKLLARKVGSWTARVTMWMTPGAPPEVTDGASETRMILGGRFLEDLTSGTFNGAPFEGRGVTGYDNSKKKFVYSWIDNMGTGIMIGTGTYDPKTRSFTYTSEAPDLMTGKIKKIRSVDTMIDADNWKSEAFEKGPDGKEFKSMEVVYKRRK